MSAAQVLSQLSGGKRLGQHNSKQHRQRISASSRSGDPDVRRRISESEKGKEAIAWNKGMVGAQMHSVGTRKKMSIAQKKRWSDPDERAERLVRMLRAKELPNKPEKHLLGLICHLGFTYVGDRKFWVTGADGSRFNPDFVHRSKKLIVELYGRHWHDGGKRDIDRLAAYRRNGFRAIVVWDDDLRKNSGKQLSRVQSLARSR